MAKSSVDNRTVKTFVAALLAALLAGAGCGVKTDRLLALPLAQPPAEADWSAAVPYRLDVSGGATSLPGEADVDADSVHKVMASCHHGGKKTPVKVDVRAFYTPERLYLRFSWGDPTLDAGPLWRWQGAAWRADPERRDGLGVLWGAPGEARFSCMRACHLKDWRVAGARAFADYVMGAPDGGPLDFWIWRAGRGSASGAAEDASLTPEGRKGDGAAGEETPFERPNSLLFREGRAGSFGEGDTPARTPAPEPGATAPGYEIADPAPGRAEVEAQARHGDGGWTLTLSRSLTGRDPGDAVFRPGQEISFGLAVLDGVALDHNAAGYPIRLLLVEEGRLPRPGAGD